ncbi:MAG: SWIM zinc finger family protein [Prevotellaceae bacterium]|jgi:hypothetical protein|nr:SWIM zinc finger family protein [Prevotellaceae bacterium]
MNTTVKEKELLSSNAAADGKEKKLVCIHKFSGLSISQDGSLIWAKCTGTGADSYFCSVDYTDKNKPVFQCSCSSTHFPCRHSTGLSFVFQKGIRFDTAEIPEELRKKQTKTNTRAKKNKTVKSNVMEKTSGQSNKQQNIKSIIKKIEIQLSGIEIARKLLQNIVQMGVSGIDASTGKIIAERVQELGNYYIEGIQLAFNNLLVELNYVKNDEYINVINQLNYISVLLKKSREYLTAKKENPHPELTSAIEEQIGHVWKLADLMKYGMYAKNAELVQLSFNCCDNAGRKAFVDEAFWLNLKSGKICKSKNYRPYKALRYIKEENSCFEVLQLPELFIYPGDINPRVRWESQKSRLVTDGDRVKMINCSRSDYADVVKTAKSIIKNPLMEKNPVVLLKLNRAYIAGEHIVLEDNLGNRLTVADLPEQHIHTETALKSILPEKCENIALTAMINNNIKTNMFSVTALSLITPDSIIRLLY